MIQQPVAFTGSLAVLTWDTLRQVFRPPLELRETIEQMYRLGVTSLPVVALTMFSTGAVMTLQVSNTLSAYGANIYVGAFTGLSMVKELGPVLTAVMMAARVGSGISAELGSMQVTEQIDALRALGASPVKRLVLPRLAALLLLTPVVTVIGMALGIAGGLYVAVAEIGQDAGYFFSVVRQYVTISDILLGLAKTLFFAYFIGIIACRNGMEAHGGATGVGEATTRTVVGACIAIFLSNFFLSKLSLLIQGWL